MDVLRDLVLPELGKLGALRRSGAGWMARCPVHEDRQNSLSIAEGRDHPVVFHCHAGCEPEDVCKALGLDWSVLSKPREQLQHDRGFVAVYDYRDENGELLFQVCRTADKKFLQRKPDPSSRDGYMWKLGDTRRVLYRLQKVVKAVERNHEIYIVEGEKDVHSLENQGLVGTCNPGGAGKWKPEYTECLRDAVAVIIADKDKPGQAHARQVREALQGVAADVTVKEAAGDEKVKDITDHFSAGLTLDDLITTWPPDAASKPLAAVELWAFLDASDAPPEWVLPELLERNDRLLLTGFEGLGKSMLVRQLALCAAAGLHPFDPGKHSNFDPKRVLFIDCENSETQGRRKMRPIAMAMKNYNRAPLNNMMFVIHRPDGIDLDTDDADWLIEQVTGYKPDLLVIGPFYKLHSGDINKEENARRVAAVLDHARAISGAAMLIEAHAGHGEPGKNRSVRPIGSSLLLRWPEFGYGLVHNELAQPDQHGRSREIDVKSWRGPRDDRDWPKNLQYGPPGHLPWVAWEPPEKKGAAP